MNKMIFLYVTFESAKEAKKISRHLLKNHLIGCANIFPVNAIYRWRKRLVDEKEFVLLLKTTKENYQLVKDEIIKLHSSEIPCIIKIEAGVNKEYWRWLESEIKR